MVGAVLASAAPLTLSPSEFRSCGADHSLVPIAIMVAEHQVGLLRVSGHADGTLRVDVIGIDRDLQRRGYGRAAIDLVRAIAQREQYLRLAGEVEWGTPEVMLGRRIFAEKCGFTANKKDDTLKLEFEGGAS
jgi:ribosomal protein S18 acetylase RimI-like enzyme